MSETVVSADWLIEHRDQVTIVDVREEWEYDAIGHIPRAVDIPFEALRAEEHAVEGGGDEGMLPGEDVFASLFGDVGLDRTDRIVAYDDHHGVFAARVLVTALLYGHPADQLHLLDGDFSAWQRAHEVSTTPPEIEETTYKLDRPAETPLVDTATVAEAIDDEETVIVDTREQWEFDEGHIPGAIWLDWRELVDDETRGLKSREEMESILTSRGISPEKRVLLYCNTARRISHTYLVLTHLGYPDLAFYEGSLTEWAAEGRPVQEG